MEKFDVKLSGSSITSTNLTAFWIFFALFIIFFHGTPDLFDCIRLKLLNGHPEKQEIIWEQVISELKENQ